jgi:hypothetical protein
MAFRFPANAILVLNPFDLNRFLLFLFLVSFFACHSKTGSEATKKDAVARVYDAYLNKEDLEGLVPDDIHGQDSINLVRNFISNWIRQQVVLKNAEDNLDEEKKDVEKKLQEYRNSSSPMPMSGSSWPSSSIRWSLCRRSRRFNTANQANFELKDNIIKVIYLKLNRNSPKLGKVKEWYKSENARDRQLLTEYAMQYALNYYLDDQSWLFFDDLVKEIPPPNL